MQSIQTDGGTRNVDRVASMGQSMRVDVDEESTRIVIFVRHEQVRGGGEDLLVEFNQISRGDQTESIDQAFAHESRAIAMLTATVHVGQGESKVLRSVLLRSRRISIREAEVFQR